MMNELWTRYSVSLPTQEIGTLWNALLDEEGKPSFKLSEPVSVVYKSESMQDMVEEVLSRIVWLLKEAQKPVEASQSGVKRVRSTGDLAIKSN